MEYKVSVIVELEKSKKKLKQTLNSLKEQTLDFNSGIQVILLANDSVEEDYLQFCEEYAALFGECCVLEKRGFFRDRRSLDQLSAGGSGMDIICF